MDHDLNTLIDLAHRAGKLVMDVYEGDFVTREKEDGSALTEADERAEKLILEGLAKAFPDVPVLAEEAAARGEIPELGGRFILVDPLDGTREFSNRTGEFTVNIALVEDGVPVMGVVYAPAMAKMYAGASGRGAWLQSLDAKQTRSDAADATEIKTRKRPAQGLVAVASRSHRSAETETLLADLGVTDFEPAGSSLKFCLVATGEADVYPRLGRTMEWDTAAGQAVLEAAGGRVHVLDSSGTEGEPLRYGKAERGYDNPHFIAWGE
ncbi:3'(2'),5'-bisphosphate nucleotidase CysQ [Parvularcula dongshanensis]|uniref:3'(2'),5'-bisphosphate nucleotidase CysQ n=1 Tax=Parvularcula dongshanensis TaxID=1173995 RepID=A0A840I5U5_9PROT|nr:3'(2'),5'-bisphosphate nucleotidase CysQ [Parvularcula dongshanensis]MBB4659782.1 3'(2'), 5'-bisphosphate nucleotidase [Parvularcula dongshanensis]